MATRIYPGRRCPRCGSSLLTNERSVWCTYVGTGEPGTSCRYGMDRKVPAPSLPPVSCAECQDWGCGKCLDPEPTVIADRESGYE